MHEKAMQRWPGDANRADPPARAALRARAWTAAAIAMLITAVSGCGDHAATSGAGTPAKASIFRIVANDGVFDAPHRLSAGLRHIVFENHGTRQHEAMFIKLSEGMTRNKPLTGHPGRFFFSRVRNSFHSLVSPGATSSNMSRPAVSRMTA